MSHGTTLEITMNHRKGDKHMFNAVLAKFLGFDNILNPTSKKLGGYNGYHVFFGILIVYTSLMSVIPCFNGLYYWTIHRVEALMYIGMGLGILFTCWKMSILIRRWRQIRDCLTITRFDFTSYGRFGGARLLELCRNRIVLITFVYAIGCSITTMLFVLSPFMFRHGVSTMKSLDGSQSNYRINVLNLYAIFSAETYNTYFNMIYIMEASTFSICIFFVAMFDTIFITLCLAFSCQLNVINVTFTSSGPKRITMDSFENKNDEEIKSIIYYSPFEHSLAYNGLKAIIKDHQSIIQKLEIFFSIFQLVMLSQIVASAFLIIATLLTISTELADKEINQGSRARMIKMISSCPLALIQLFMTCYLFESIHSQKESTGFALYDSNWTEMDMKCKNLILLTMRMNDAHKQKLKFSELKIVNLEIFFSTIRVCYSILSVMIKSKPK